MKCIVKKVQAVLLAISLTAGVIGCGSEVRLEEPYDLFETTQQYIPITDQRERADGSEKDGAASDQTEDDSSGQNGGSKADSTDDPGAFFAQKLCVGGKENTTAEGITEELSYAAGLFDLTNLTIPYARNIYEQVYPASTTKVLTAYVALKYGDLTAKATVSEAALQLEEGSSVSGLAVGDQIDLNQLLYGLILCSGNDAANVIAELVSGSTEEFVKRMNEEAKVLGATKSHFMNAHGLPDEQHYTCIYDLYLILEAAMQDERFRQILNTSSFTAEYVNSQGEPVTKEWETSNLYLKGEKEIPQGITVVGGKTGTTLDAGSCLVLYSETEAKRPYISIVMKASNKDELYQQMTELLNYSLVSGG